MTSSHRGPDHALVLAIHQWALTVEEGQPMTCRVQARRDEDTQHTHHCPICELDWSCESPPCRAYRISVCPECEDKA